MQRFPSALAVSGAAALAACLAAFAPIRCEADVDACGGWPSPIHINFDDCGDPGFGPQFITLDCADSLASTVLVASVIADATYDDIIADLGFADVYVGFDWWVMPAFWQFHQGGCAGPALLEFSSDFTSYSRCADMWQGRASTEGVFGGVGGPVPEGKRGRIIWSSAVTPSDPVRIQAGQETYVARVRIRQNHLGRCPGCEAPACAVYTHEEFARLNGMPVTFFGGTAVVFNCPDRHQCVPTPVRATSWGRVKAIYR